MSIYFHIHLLVVIVFVFFYQMTKSTFLAPGLININCIVFKLFVCGLYVPMGVGGSLCDYMLLFCNMKIQKILNWLIIWLYSSNKTTEWLGVV